MFLKGGSNLQLCSSFTMAADLWVMKGNQFFDLQASFGQFQSSLHLPANLQGKVEAERVGDGWFLWVFFLSVGEFLRTRDCSFNFFEILSKVSAYSLTTDLILLQISADSIFFVTFFFMICALLPLFLSHSYCSFSDRLYA